MRFSLVCERNLRPQRAKKRHFHDMRQINLPPQLVRLILLTIGIVVSYLSARYILTPSSFGDFGGYRGNALQEIAIRSPVFVGKEACGECHSDQFEAVLKFEHKTVSCEACHGPGPAHSDDFGVLQGSPSDPACMRCHEANPSKPKWYKQITKTDHYEGDGQCAECHTPHHPNEDL